MCLTTLLSLFPAIPGKGLAMATYCLDDLELLNVSPENKNWWYVWGWKTDVIDPCYVSMSRNWERPEQFAGRIHPKYLLLGNEPNNTNPYQGYLMSPEGAANITLAYQEYFPNTTLIVGNVSADKFPVFGDGVTWLKDFLGWYESLSGKSFDHILGCHTYNDSVRSAIKQFDAYLKVYPRMWLTEFALCKDRISKWEMFRIMRAAGKRFERFAWYTNTQPEGNPANIPYDVDLCKNGELTALGKLYAKL